MNVTVDTREFSIVVVAKSHNPTILNPDFLKDNEIVPANWELEKPPVCLEPVAEIVFKNKVRIIAQLDKLIFLRMLRPKAKRALLYLSWRRNIPTFFLTLNIGQSALIRKGMLPLVAIKMHLENSFWKG